MGAWCHVSSAVWINCTLKHCDPEALWIDLIRPGDEERRWVKEVYGQELPSIESMVEIEASSRFFEDEQGLHLRS